MQDTARKETMMSSKRVAIVGCGVSGLVSIKSCLEEGLHPVCFEMQSDLGGVWNAELPRTESSGPRVYDSLITNTSKLMTNFSDFPCPSDYPPYLPHHLFLQYLKSYADHFSLLKCVHFSTKVVSVCKSHDFDATGCWKVTTQTGNDSGDTQNKIQMWNFDCVMLCQGFFVIPYTPHLPGIKEFQGRVQHVQQYRSPELYRGRNVVVVGNASSAGDVACDIATVAKQVYLSIGDGAYVISRIVNGCTPLDFKIRRIFTVIPDSVSMRILVAFAKKWLDPVFSGIQPERSKPLTQVSFIINDQLPFKIMAGQVKVVDHIVSLGQYEVCLGNGTTLDAVDDIVFATGYKPAYHAVDAAILSSVPEDKLELFKMIFPISIAHNTLAVIGCFRSNGPSPPIVEIQARLAAAVFAGKHKLPDPATMKNDVDCMNKQLFKKYGCYKYAFSPLGLRESIAAELGVKPSWWHLLLLGEIQMALSVLFGPAYPFHYRLVGRGSWHGAKSAILHAHNETVFSVQHRKLEEDGFEKKLASSWKKFLLHSCAYLTVIYIAVWLRYS